MPVPVSVTQIDTYWPTGRSCLRAARSSSHLFAVSIVSLPPSGIASRALMHRFSTAFSSWFGSTNVGHKPLAPTTSTSTAGPDRAPDKFLKAAEKAIDVGRLGIERLPSRKREQAMGQRCRTFDCALAASKYRSSSAVRPCAIRICIISRLPLMPVSRLLKSCARPPVSWPTASIFCDWRSCSSIARLLAQIASDLCEADQLAGFVTDRIDDDAGPESRPVLADSPALCLEPPFVPGSLESDARNLRLPVLLGVEAREMLTHDLVGGIALESLGAGIPAAYPSFRVEHVNGIVSDALDEQAEPLLARRSSSSASLRSVRSRVTLANPTSSPVGIANRVDDHVGPEPAAVFAYSPAFDLEAALALGCFQRNARNLPARDPLAV